MRGTRNFYGRGEEGSDIQVVKFAGVGRGSSSRSAHDVLVLDKQI